MGLQDLVLLTFVLGVPCWQVTSTLGSFPIPENSASDSVSHLRKKHRKKHKDVQKIRKNNLDAKWRFLYSASTLYTGGAFCLTNVGQIAMWNLRNSVVYCS